MDNPFLNHILENQKIDYAIFDSNLHLMEWSKGLQTYRPSSPPLVKGLRVVDLFPELFGYEDILTEIRLGEKPPMLLDRIEKISSSQDRTLDPCQIIEFYSLEAYKVQEQLAITVRDVTEEANLERNIIQKRNELDLANSRLINDLKKANQELVQAYITTLEGWAHALEGQDFGDLKGHARRVIELTARLGRLMGANEEEIKYYCYGALLYDIGIRNTKPEGVKTETSLEQEELLNMGGKLPSAQRLLSPIRYLSKSLNIPLFHHEKWDGSGLPIGLKGEDIPLPARIYSIVEAYDELLFDPLKDGLVSEQSVVEFIKAQSGTQFDPRVVEGLLKTIQPV